MPKSESCTETIVLDESGTPGTGVGGDGVFVVGGLAIYGCAYAVEAAWKARYAGQPLGDAKGKDLDESQIREIVEFVKEFEILPIATHCRLSSDQFAGVERRVRSIDSLALVAPDKPTNARGYLWVHHVGVAMMTLLVGSVAAHHGPICGIDLRVDQFTLNERLRRNLEAVVKRWADPLQRIFPLLDEIDVLAPSHPHVATIRQNVRWTKDDVAVQWKARGPLGRLADIAASVYRRKLIGDEDARRGWALLTEAVKKKYGEVPRCLDFDQTVEMLKRLSKPVVPNEEAQ